MATEDDDMVLSRQKYGTKEISGNYAEFANAMGGTASASLSRRIFCTRLCVASARLRKTPVLLEFITAREKTFSTG